MLPAVFLQHCSRYDCRVCNVVNGDALQTFIFSDRLFCGDVNNNARMCFCRFDGECDVRPANGTRCLGKNHMNIPSHFKCLYFKSCYVKYVFPVLRFLRHSVSLLDPELSLLWRDHAIFCIRVINKD